MKKQINFPVTDKHQLTEKVIEYFTQSGFKFINTTNDKIKFIHNSSILDTWTLNPLKWGSEITVSLSNNEVTADFCVDTESQMNTIEEEYVWNTFIGNFKTFLTNGIDFKCVNEKAVTYVKRSRLYYIGWAVLGALVGGLVGMFFSDLTGNKVIGYFSIPILATFFLSNRINYRKAKNAL